eukprot:UN21859
MFVLNRIYYAQPEYDDFRNPFKRLCNCYTKKPLHVGLNHPPHASTMHMAPKSPISFDVTTMNNFEQEDFAVEEIEILPMQNNLKQPKRTPEPANRISDSTLLKDIWQKR